jgi:hypothetical protein
MRILSILSHVIADNEPLNSRFAQLGIPAKFGNVSITNEGSAPPLQAWKWNSQGEQVSNLDIRYAAPSSGPIGPQIERLAWWDGEQLGLLDVTWNHEVSELPLTTAIGHYSSEMLNSGAGRESFAGLVDLNFASYATADLQQFGDPQCEQPLS